MDTIVPLVKLVKDGTLWGTSTLLHRHETDATFLPRMVNEISDIVLMGRSPNNDGERAESPEVAIVFRNATDYLRILAADTAELSEERIRVLRESAAILSAIQGVRQSVPMSAALAMALRTAVKDYMETAPAALLSQLFAYIDHLEGGIAKLDSMELDLAVARVLGISEVPLPDAEE